jgi:hypothetical protein
MITLREAAQMALDFVESHSKYWNGTGAHPQTIVIALREALAEQPAEQEPVAQCPRCNGSGDIVVMDSAGPDALEVPAPCPHCGGSGSLADAYHGVVKLLEKKSDDYLKCCAELYVRPIAPQPRKRLTDAEIESHDCILVLWHGYDAFEIVGIKEFARAIEAAHGITGEMK